MKKIYAPFLCLLALATQSFSQKVFQARVNKTNVNLRGAPVVLAQVTISAPFPGKVMVRFDGDCISTVGDRIVLAASRTESWGGSDNSLYVKAISTDLNSNVFSHTRVYDVPAGESTFYAVGENYAETAGSGTASVYGSLLAEWFPETPGQAFVRHQGISKNNFNVEGAPVILAQETINVPASGKIVVRFDGLCISSDGDLIMLAASDNPGWGAYDGSSSIEIVDHEFNKNSFAHVRTYDVTPGSHTFYAVIENYYEIYGNGIASVLGSLTVAYYPDASPVIFTQLGIVQLGATIDNGPVILGEINLDLPTTGKVLVNFSGTCIGSFGDYIKLAASNTPNWSENDGNLGFEPFSSDRNRTSFSHTRLYEANAGAQQFYAIAQNVQEFFGSGLAVVYGSLTATFFPDNAVAVQESYPIKAWTISPNPSADFIIVQWDGQTDEQISLLLTDEKGAVLQRMNNIFKPSETRLTMDVSKMPQGLYFIRLEQGASSSTKPFIRM